MLAVGFRELSILNLFLLLPIFRDWYNLETSKRIRAFHCGDDKAFIKKARAYANKSKRLDVNGRKYARREEAILQALDIEKYHLNERKNGHLYLRKPTKVSREANSKLSPSIDLFKGILDLHTVEVKMIQEESHRSVITTGGSNRKVNRISSCQSEVCADERFLNLTSRKNCQAQLTRVLEDDDSLLWHGNGNLKSKPKELSKTDDSSLGGSSEAFDPSDEDCEEILDGDDLESFDDGLTDVPVIWKDIRARGMWQLSYEIYYFLSQNFIYMNSYFSMSDIFSGYVSHRSSDDSTAELDEFLNESDASSFTDSPKHQNTRTTEKEISQFGSESNVSSDESPISSSEGSHSQVRNKQKWVFTGAHTSSSKRKEAIFSTPAVCKRSKKLISSRDQSISFGSSFYDVQVDADAIYCGPHSSVISLMSRFDGKVLGQPISVEVVEDLENFSIDFFPKHKRSHRRRNGKLTGVTSLMKSERMALENKRKGFLGRKTRRLSLLEVKGRRKVEEGKAVACVPLTHVFRRINEALTLPSRLRNPR